MSERARNAAIIALGALLIVVLFFTISYRPASEDRVESIGARIKCPVCQGESIAESPAQMAKDMLAIVSERVDQGFGDEAIIKEILSSYSGALLLDPPVSGNTLVLWLAPLVALIAGGAVILWWRAHPGDEGAPHDAAPDRRRAMIGAFVLVGALALIIVIASSSLQDRSGSSSGVAALTGEELADVSNETLEAVVAANTDNPQINGMRLALAERYYEEFDYRSAFPHYLAVAESDDASPAEVVTALVRLAWMTYEGNGEVDTALTLVDQALQIDPDSQIARYVKATVTWCGKDDPTEAARLLSELLADPGLAAESRAQIQSDLDRVTGNERCP